MCVHVGVYIGLLLAGAGSGQAPVGMSGGAR